MNNNDFRYDIYINQECVDSVAGELKGIAYMKFESAKLMGLAEIHRIYIGDKYDPVIHYTTVERGGIKPPCPENSKKCKYRQSKKSEFYATTRPTAYRIELLSPVDRCGFMLKPSRIGGQFDDYAACLKG